MHMHMYMCMYGSKGEHMNVLPQFLSQNEACPCRSLSTTREISAERKVATRWANTLCVSALSSAKHRDKCHALKHTDNI